MKGAEGIEVGQTWVGEFSGGHTVRLVVVAVQRHFPDEEPTVIVRRTDRHIPSSIRAGGFLALYRKEMDQ